MGRNSTNNDNSAVGAEFASVVSPNGFSTGDLVYRSPNGYGVMPSGAVSSATFPATSTAVQYFQGQLETSSVGMVSTVRGGGQDDQCAAQLTNGNIVVVYRRASTGINNANMFFVIVDQNNTVVVSETSVSASYVTSNGGYPIPISVIALTGGGFVVGWTYDSAGGANNFCWAIFDNVGNTIAGASTDTSFDTGNGAYYTFRLRARPDGRWLVTTVNSTYTQRTRVYNANGSTYTAWLAPGQNADRWSGVDAVVFSDSSFLTIVSQGNNIRWYLYNAAGTQLNTNTVAGFNGSSQAGLAKLSTDVAVVYQATGSGLNIARFTLSTQTWSAVSSITTTANQTSSSVASLSVYTIPGTDNNIVAYTSTYGSATTDGYGCLTYSIINGSTGTIVGSQNNYLVRPWNFFQSSCYMVFIPISGYYRGFSHLGGGSSANVTVYSSAMPNGTLTTGYIDINASTYQPRLYDSLTVSIGNTSALALGAYSKNASTPTSASFLAAATSTQTVSIARGTALLGQTVVDSTACSGYRLIALSTGNFIALYQYNSSAIIKFTVYNSSGVAQGTYTVATATISVFQGVAGCELADGKIVIAYHDTTSLIRFVIYSPSFTVLYTGSFSGYLTGSSGMQNNTLQISPMFYNNYWVAASVDNTNYCQATVFDNAGTQLTNLSVGSGLTSRTVSIAGLPGNNFVAMFGYTAGSYYYNQYRGYGTGYTQITSSPIGSASTIKNLAIGVSQFGSFIYPDHSGSTLTGTYFRSIYSNNQINLASAASVASNTSVLTCGCSANGVAVTYISSADKLQCFYPTQAVASTGGNWEVSTSSIITSKASTDLQNATLAPLWGPYMVVGVCNSSFYPTFSIIAVEDTSYSVPITAGVTQSNPVTIDTSNGFSLIGVAASDCAAGGAGQVQTKGTAVLSSSYPTTTQTFDFTNPVTYGVKGTVSNRVITLED